MRTLQQLLEQKESLLVRINTLQAHIINLNSIGGEGRLMLAGQFVEKVGKLKQRVYEVNLEIDQL